MCFRGYRKSMRSTDQSIETLLIASVRRVLPRTPGFAEDVEGGGVGGGREGGPSASVEEGSDRKPNVFFILIDDMGYADIGYQSTDLALLTPNLDALMSGGRKVWVG